MEKNETYSTITGTTYKETDLKEVMLQIVSYDMQFSGIAAKRCPQNGNLPLQID